MCWASPQTGFCGAPLSSWPAEARGFADVWKHCAFFSRFTRRPFTANSDGLVDLAQLEGASVRVWSNIEDAEALVGELILMDLSSFWRVVRESRWAEAVALKWDAGHWHVVLLFIECVCVWNPSASWITLHADSGCSRRSVQAPQSSLTLMGVSAPL